MSEVRSPYQTLRDAQDERETIAAILERLKDRMVLNLGCGNRSIDGAINHDIRSHSEMIDIAFDLDVMGGNRHLNWPIPDERFEKVIALDVFEHLRADPQAWISECWRILKDEGQLIIRVSAWDNPVSYRDPTHRRVFHPETMDYFCPDRQLWKEYGSIYFPDGPWFTHIAVERTNPDPRWPSFGDLGFVLQKRASP